MRNGVRSFGPHWQGGSVPDEILHGLDLAGKLSHGILKPTAVCVALKCLLIEPVRSCVLVRAEMHFSISATNDLTACISNVGCPASG